MVAIRDVHSDWVVAQLNGQDYSAFRNTVKRKFPKAEVYSPRLYYVFRGRGMRRPIIKDEMMFAGYVFIQTDRLDDLLLDEQLKIKLVTFNKEVGTVTGSVVQDVRDSEVATLRAAERRLSQIHGYDKKFPTYEKGQKVVIDMPSLAGETFTVQKQEGSVVELKFNGRSIFGKSVIKADVSTIKPEARQATAAGQGA
mgnify:CR=1 FL=1